jgi:hypothetical protein
MVESENSLVTPRPELFTGRISNGCCLFNSKFYIIAAAVVVSLLFVALINGRASRLGESERQSLAVALSQVQVANARAAVASAQVAVQTARADSAAKTADRYSLSSRKSSADASLAGAKFDSAARANVCDTGCIGAARLAHLADTTALASANAALASETVAAARYKLGLDAATASLTELRTAATQVVVKAKPLVKPPRRLSALLPSVGAGVAAGLDLHGAPNVVTGVTFGWKF